MVRPIKDPNWKSPRHETARPISEAESIRERLDMALHGYSPKEKEDIAITLLGHPIKTMGDARRLLDLLLINTRPDPEQTDMV